MIDHMVGRMNRYSPGSSQYTQEKYDENNEGLTCG